MASNPFAGRHAGLRIRWRTVGRVGLLGLLGIGALAGCNLLAKREMPPTAAAPAKSVRRVTVRLHLATAQALPGYHKTFDETGRTIYVAPEPVLDEFDVECARAYHGERGNFVELTLTPRAAPELARITREHLGFRLAIFVGGDLVTTPSIHSPIDTGKAYISGSLSLERAEAIARLINGQ